MKKQVLIALLAVFVAVSFCFIGCKTISKKPLYAEHFTENSIVDDGTNELKYSLRYEIMKKENNDKIVLEVSNAFDDFDFMFDANGNFKKILKSFMEQSKKKQHKTYKTV